MKTLMNNTKKVMNYIENQAIALGLARHVTFPNEKIERASDFLVARGKYEKAFETEMSAKTRPIQYPTIQDAVLVED